jgi:hypothetical protein
VVILKSKIKRPPGAPNSVSWLAPGQSHRGTIYLDCRRKAAVFLLVGNDHLGRPGSGF